MNRISVHIFHATQKQTYCSIYGVFSLLFFFWTMVMGFTLWHSPKWDHPVLVVHMIWNVYDVNNAHTHTHCFIYFVTIWKFNNSNIISILFCVCACLIFFSMITYCWSMPMTIAHIRCAWCIIVQLTKIYETLALQRFYFSRTFLCVMFKYFNRIERIQILLNHLCCMFSGWKSVNEYLLRYLLRELKRICTWLLKSFEINRAKCPLIYHNHESVVFLYDREKRTENAKKSVWCMRVLFI